MRARFAQDGSCAAAAQLVRNDFLGRLVEGEMEGTHSAAPISTRSPPPSKRLHLCARAANGLPLVCVDVDVDVDVAVDGRRRRRRHSWTFTSPVSGHVHDYVHEHAHVGRFGRRVGCVVAGVISAGAADGAVSRSGDCGAARGVPPLIPCRDTESSGGKLLPHSVVT